MDPDAPIIISGLAIIAGTIVIVVRTWVNRPRGASVDVERRLEAMEGRLARMEQSIDAIAVEAERISEGQRFTTRLLSERVPDAVPIPRPGASHRA